MRAIDLHTHSTCSDGTYTVQKLMDYAYGKGLAAIALTDHDTVKGLKDADEYVKANYPDMEFVPGIEFSTVNEGKDVHIVGLYMNYNDKELLDTIDSFMNSRIERNVKMCKKLSEGAGIDITFEALQEANPDTVITRAHFAKYMVEHGYCSSKQEVFDRFIGDNCPYYVPRENITPEMAIETIVKNGGVPILAHPVLYHMSDEKLETLVVRLIDAGLAGLEAIYSTYEAYEERQMKELAEKHGLLISGGSDFHGDNKPAIDLGVGYGKLFVPENLLEPIKNYG
ncbi:PHP domain-containing protein [Butyrivibrio sp. VCB2006]|uniref:PHP domain-containing protein n=1 Tax=Butyrivibrio sp. VCB2006 TaxID=1280679 RepID=UPI0004095532|nr:PHP domain-containing protein [Butyrivibrio sp. VCB2006]